MWGTVVVGTHPSQGEVEVWLELYVNDRPMGRLPTFYLETKGVNCLWHAPIPPQPVNTRIRYRSVLVWGGEEAFSPDQELVVRPNLPDRTEVSELVADGLVGNQRMTVRVDSRGSTYDIYYPTVGLHSNVRPAEGDLPQSRAHFRSIVGGLGLGRRLDWFSERLSWEARQRYEEGSNLLVTELLWRRGPFVVEQTDLVVMGAEFPKTMGGVESAGQYIKRFRIWNRTSEDRHAIFGVYVQAEVNGGIGEPGLSWEDTDRCLLASNRGHSHTNRKLARDATVEFAIALDDAGPVDCEPTGANEAMLLRSLVLPAGGSVQVDLLVSGGFTGWRGDPGTFDHWLRPALSWFRKVDLDQVESLTSEAWERFRKTFPGAFYPEPVYERVLSRSSLTAAMHFDAEWGAVATSFDRGLNAYCWPREGILAARALERVGHGELGRALFRWLRTVRGQTRGFRYWFHKYTIDGVPEWEAPSIDQTALIPWGIEQSTRWSGDLQLAEQNWPAVQQAAEVCMEGCRHPGLRWNEELSLMSSSGMWETRYGAYLYGNAVVVAGLRSAAYLAGLLGKDEEKAKQWRDRAELILQRGILREAPRGGEAGPGLVDPVSGRFLEARHLSRRRGLWAESPDLVADQSAALDLAVLALAIPFGLLPASDPRLFKTAQAILEHNVFRGSTKALTAWANDPSQVESTLTPTDSHRDDMSCMATLWMARYLLQLGRETGEGAYWTQAVSFLDAMIERLSPLGNSVWAGRRTEDYSVVSARWLHGVWGVHGSLVETILDLAGLEYDALERKIILRPALPPRWPILGLSQRFACGEVSFRMRRSQGGRSYQLTVETRLSHPVELVAEITCPGMTYLEPWQGPEGHPRPRLEVPPGRLSWTTKLPKGDQSLAWSWGDDQGELFSGV